MSCTYLVANEWFFHRGWRNTSPGDPDGAGVDGVNLDSVGWHERWVAPGAFYKREEIQNLTGNISVLQCCDSFFQLSIQFIQQSLRHNKNA